MDFLALFGVGTNLMFSLGIIFVMIFTIFYIRQRLTDFDTKMTSMFQLVTKITSEIRNIKEAHHGIQTNGTPLDTIHEDEEYENDTENVKNIRFGGGSHDIDDDDDVDDDDDDDDDDNQVVELVDSSDDDISDDDTSDADDDSETRHGEVVLARAISTHGLESNTEDEEDTVVKVIDFNKELSDKETIQEIPNYKKFKYDELKTMVSTRGLANDVNKLKKAELVVILEDSFRKSQSRPNEEDTHEAIAH
jgi:hypothetical protein